MKAKDKVLKNYPNAVCVKKCVGIKGIQIEYSIVINGKTYGRQMRENWAWAETVRDLDYINSGGSL